ncbi:MAG: glycosyltransferase family 4 protein [bacterium]
MKILISVHAIWWNASAHYAITTAEALQRRGHDVTVIAHKSTPAYGEAVKQELSCIGSLNLLIWQPLTAFQNQRALRKLLQEERFDVLNPHRPEDHFHLGWAHWMTKCQSILIRSVSDVRIPRTNVFNRHLFQKQTHGVIYCAECCRQRYQSALEISPIPSRIVYSALDVEAFTRGDWKTDNSYFQHSRPRIGIVARLSPNKGHKTLIDAAAMICAQLPQATFFVVGQEEEVTIAGLRDYARNQNVENSFVFTGRLDDPRPVIAACDIGVITSTDSEVISRAAQEFFAFGIPVIASTINVLPEMIQPDYNGFLIPAGDSYQLAQRILELANSETLRLRLGEGASASAVLKYSLDVMGRDTEEFFLQVIQEKRLT